MAPPQNQKPDSDVVARAAVERSDKLEAELKTKQAELDALKLKLAGNEASGSLMVKPGEPTFINGRGQVVPEKFRGTKSYTLKQPHYREGTYFGAGQTITVTDEKPSRTWEPVKARPVAAPVDVEPTSRPSDQQV